MTLDFSSLVLMERDNESGFLTKEIGSYEVGDGAQYITKMYYDGEKVNMFFDTNKDVEEWEFSAIYDLFNEEVFEENGYNIEEVDDEYNPTWVLRFDLDEDHSIMEEKVMTACSLIKEEIEEVFNKILGKEEEYK